MSVWGARRQHAMLVCVAACLLQAGALSQSVPIPTGSSCDSCMLGGEPVCGADGTTYSNECIASCQGVDIVPCEGPTSELTGPTDGPTLNSFQVVDKDMEVTVGSVSFSTMKAMSDLGYSYVARTLVVDEAFYDGAYDGSSTIDVPVNDTEDKGLGRGVAIVFPENDVYIQQDVSNQVTGKDYPLADCTWGCDGGFVAVTNDTWNETVSGGSRALMEVIGKDQRKPAMKKEFPNTAVIQLRFLMTKTGYAGCSGACISPSVVLTAGHCVYSADRKKKAYYAQKSYQFFTDFDGNGKPIQLDAVPTKIVTTKGWIKDANHAYDIAVIYLDKPACSQGVMAFMRAGYDCHIDSYDFTVNGFPGELARGQREYSKCHVRANTCSNNMMMHTCDTTPGQSGSPVYTDDNMIRAVHVCSFGAKGNCATMLRPNIFNIVKTAYDSTNKD